MKIDELRNSLIGFDLRFQEKTHKECWNSPTSCVTTQVFFVEGKEQTISIEVTIQYKHDAVLAKKIWVKIQPEQEEVLKIARSALMTNAYLRKLFINGLPQFFRNSHQHFTD